MHTNNAFLSHYLNKEFQKVTPESFPNSSG